MPKSKGVFMKHKVFLVCGLLVALLSGCHRIILTRNAGPTTYSYEYAKDLLLPYSPLEGEDCFASIGDTIVSRGKKFKVYKNYVVYKSKVYPLNLLPKRSSWISGYLYESKSGKTYEVISSEDWVDGTMGVIIDQDGILSSKYTFVKLIKKFPFWFARSRQCYSHGQGEKFFGEQKIPFSLWEPWGIRYGGVDESGYHFDIIKTSDANISERIQEITISKKDAEEGVTIKGIKMQIKKTDDPGVVNYQILSYPAP